MIKKTILAIMGNARFRIIRRSGVTLE